MLSGVFKKRSLENSAYMFDDVTVYFKNGQLTLHMPADAQGLYQMGLPTEQYARLLINEERIQNDREMQRRMAELTVPKRIKGEQREAAIKERIEFLNNDRVGDFGPLVDVSDEGIARNKKISDFLMRCAKRGYKTIDVSQSCSRPKISAEMQLRVV